MSWESLAPIVLALLALLGGVTGQKLLDRWFDRDKVRRDAASVLDTRTFSDNEHARTWLAQQLQESDADVKALRAQERELLKQVSDLAAQVARQEERLKAQAERITTLERDVAQLQTERDSYRAEVARLTADRARRQREGESTP